MIAGQASPPPRRARAASHTTRDHAPADGSTQQRDPAQHGRRRSRGGHRSAAGAADRMPLACLEQALVARRAAGDQRTPFAIIAGCFEELGVALPERSERNVSLAQARGEWLARLRSSRRSESTVGAYSVALDELIGWLEQHGREREAFGEHTITAYLEDYRRRARPAPATYYRRFTLLRRFYRWLSARAGVPDPFLELQAPRKPRQEADWLTPGEFARMLDAAANPLRRRAGLVERDSLVLLTLVATGLRRAELIALDWGDVDVDAPRPSLLVRAGKGGRPRRQPLARELARALAQTRGTTATPNAAAPVFTGLAGGRLQPTILAAIVRRAAQRAAIEKHVPSTRCVTPPRPGSARRPATRAWSPSTSATQTSRPSAATPTSQRPSSTMPRRRSPPKPACTQLEVVPAGW